MYSGVKKLTIKNFPGLSFEPEIFGYASKGLPGLEIVGLGLLSRSIKEKIIYVLRSQKFKIPLKRYVICVDTKHPSENNMRFYEYPILELVKSLANEIENNKETIEAGKLSLEGDIITNERKVK